MEEKGIHTNIETTKKKGTKWKRKWDSIRWVYAFLSICRFFIIIFLCFILFTHTLKDNWHANKSITFRCLFILSSCRFFFGKIGLFFWHCLSFHLLYVNKISTWFEIVSWLMIVCSCTRILHFMFYTTPMSALTPTHKNT